MRRKKRTGSFGGSWLLTGNAEGVGVEIEQCKTGSQCPSMVSWVCTWPETYPDICKVGLEKSEAVQADPMK